ncbi:hypothetical protein [Xenorhabdus sp. KJ12.1]|uniref:hypothetical protein n=1 Tax=Xenorhabdus sp. KJ12.1 TaxID=1851571 RepID=UPI000C0605FA|nr:hypothetical protein [Xenorhabdus sp. KJ12.1]PHM72287.1 hypothetical protein Xekj_00565 [Xenorhabdus sp. KJ12.1]
MYCPNCGEHNCEEIVAKNSDAYITCGEYNESKAHYEIELDAKVLECTVCKQEFIVL